MRRNKREYTDRSMRDEREYGPYWYSGLWREQRPLLVGLTALLVVAGLLTGHGGHLQGHLQLAVLADEGGGGFVLHDLVLKAVIGLVFLAVPDGPGQVVGGAVFHNSFSCLSLAIT